LDVRQQVEEQRGVVGAPEGARLGGQAAVDVVAGVRRQGDLFEVVGALRAVRGLAGLLHGGGGQADQRRDDRDHHQQLDEGEGGPSTRPPQRCVTHGRGSATAGNNVGKGELRWIVNGAAQGSNKN